MALSEIIAAIEKEGERELQEVKTIGEKKVRELLEEYKNKGKSDAKLIIEQGVKERESYRRQHLLNAQLDQRKRVLSRKQYVTRSLIQKAAEQIVHLEDRRYSKLLQEWIIPQVVTGNEIVYLTARDKIRVKDNFIANLNAKLIVKKIPGNLKLAQEPLREELQGGFILERGKIRIDMSLTSLVKEKREDLELIIAKELFLKQEQQDA